MRRNMCCVIRKSFFFLFKKVNFDIDSLTGNFNFYVNEASADLSALSKIHKNRASTFFYVRYVSWLE